MWIFSPAVTEYNEKCFTVGYYSPDGSFIGVYQYATVYNAARVVSMLNGGSYEPSGITNLLASGFLINKAWRSDDPLL